MTRPTERDVTTERRIIEAADRLRQEHAGALDELTIARLRAARLKALEARRGRRLWQFAGGVATAGLALSLAGVMWFRPPPEPSMPQTSGAPVIDLELLALEGPEFYTDLEFYRWLASQADAS
jgi:hypothetical protein